MKNGLIIDGYGNKRWYKDDLFHREDGPAEEWGDGSKWWYINGKCHREDGPAVEWGNGYKYWFLEGKEYTEEDWHKELLIRKLAGIK